MNIPFTVFDGILVHGLNLVADKVEEQMTESALPLIAMAHHVFLQKLWVYHKESGMSLWLHLEYLLWKLLVPVEQQGIPRSFFTILEQCYQASVVWNIKSLNSALPYTFHQSCLPYSLFSYCTWKVFEQVRRAFKGA